MLPARRRLAALAAALLLALGGCGGSSSGSDETKVKDTIRQFLAAAAKGDGKRACSLSDEAGRQRLVQATGGKLDCEGVIKLLGSRLPTNLKTALENVEVKKVKIDGDKATVADSDITSTKGDLGRFLRTGRPTRLAKHGSDWKLTGD